MLWIYRFQKSQLHKINYFGSYKDNFKSEELFNAIQSIVSKQGWAISIKKSKREKLVVIGCDRGGVYCNQLNLLMEDCKRRKSRLINFPFKVQGKRKADGLWFAKRKCIT